ncbi:MULTISPECIES: 50S ribosomal protein bL37 [Brevibacterium]
MSKRGRKRKDRRNKPANHGKRPNAGR